ncbi:MAG: sulfotransferase [Firmicutes bacterium]|nr:sulfotransferase [Bacillota bacterium]
MSDKVKKQKLYKAHYLTSCRIDNWVRLLRENKFKISKDKVPQLLYMLGASILLTPFTLLESAIYAVPIRQHKMEKDPIFIIGHWRSGTTYLQNLLSKDKQFGWCDPVSTTTFCNSYLLKPLVAKVQSNVLKDARPMDNMEYKLDLPMEDVFALNLISTHSIIHLLAFPQNFRHYLKESFTDELPEKSQREWEKATRYVLNKISLRNKGKQLMLKSPDHTCHVGHLMKMYPDAKYVNIHRDPYVTIMSTINMFKKQMDLIRLNDPPENLDEILEDAIVELFEHVYTKLFKLMDDAAFKEGTLVDVPYDKLSAEPEETLKMIYEELGIDGFEDALPAFREHIASVNNYVKNKFELQPQLRDKINDKLGFYFERYGYERR